MKTSVKKIDSTKREVSIEVDGDIIKTKFDAVFEKITKEAKIPGFRPGHAPRDILEKQYASYVHEQVLKELIPDVYHQAIEQEGLEVIELPNITDVKLDRQRLCFKAEVEVAPQIPLEDYKGIKINYKKIQVLDDEIKRHLDALKESRKIDQIDDNFARSAGYPNLQELNHALERQLYLEKDNQQRQNMESQIIEHMIKDTDFKIPPSLINRQLQDLVRQAKLDLALKGMPREKIEEEEKELSHQLEPEAKKQVKIYLVLAEIAKKEKIPLDNQMPHRVMEFLLREASWKENDK